MDFGAGITSFHTIQPPSTFADKAKHLKGTMLGNFTNIPVGFESWGDEAIPYVGKTVSTLFNIVPSDADTFTDPQRPGSGQLFPRGKQWSSSNT
tara:strand:- start:1459 stop:1740 length:282 start_codon:yes stop_codon:yes gene_type:complete